MAKKLFLPGLVTEAISSQMVISSGWQHKDVPDVFFSNYGFGWFLASYRGHCLVEHGGNIDAFLRVRVFLSRQIALALLY
jgi:hypothetical protein